MVRDAKQQERKNERERERERPEKRKKKITMMKASSTVSSVSSGSVVDFDDGDENDDTSHYHRDNREDGGGDDDNTAAKTPPLPLPKRIHRRFVGGYDDHGCSSSNNNNNSSRGQGTREYYNMRPLFRQYHHDDQQHCQQQSHHHHINVRHRLDTSHFHCRNYRYMVIGLFMTTYAIVTQIWVSVQQQVPVVVGVLQQQQQQQQETATAAMVVAVTPTSKETPTEKDHDGKHKKKGRIFVDGFNQNMHILFPDYEYYENVLDGLDPFQQRRWDSNSTNNNNNNNNSSAPTSLDILINGDPLNTVTSVGAIEKFPGKILFVNGESRGDIFTNEKTNEAIRSLTRVRLQYQHPHFQNNNSSGSGSGNNNNIDDLPNDITNRIVQIGPFPNNEYIDKGSGGDGDRSPNVSPEVSARASADAAADAVAATLKTGASAVSYGDEKERENMFFGELGRRNSQEFFFFTTALGSRMVWEVDNNKYYDNNQEDVTTTTKKTSRPQTTADYGKLFPNTVAWTSLTDPSRRARNTGKFHAVAFFQSNCKLHRVTAGKKISDIVQIHHGSKCKIKNGRKPNATVLVERDKRDWTTNIELLQDYKYCLVLENKQKSHYLTEKLLNAVLAGCLPIYYGLPNIHDIFNPNSFVLYDIKNPQPALDMIQQLESNDTLYEEMLSAPLLQPGAVNRYFSIFPTLGNGSMFRRIRQMMGLPPNYLI